MLMTLKPPQLIGIYGMRHTWSVWEHTMKIGTLAHCATMDDEHSYKMLQIGPVASILPRLYTWWWQLNNELQSFQQFQLEPL